MISQILRYKVCATAIAVLSSTIFLTQSGYCDGPKTKEETSAAAKALFDQAMKEDANKNYSESIRLYTQAINVNPHYAEAYGNRGAAKFNLKDFAGALSDYNVSLKTYPDNKALLSLKAQVENVMRENATAQAEAEQRANLANQIRAQAVLGGDFADPSTMIMQNAQRRGLINAPAVDYSDPASIIMMNARNRGLVPANTPSP